MWEEARGHNLNGNKMKGLFAEQPLSFSDEVTSAINFQVCRNLLKRLIG